MRLSLGVLALALTCAASAGAQELPAVEAAKAHFRDAQAAGRTAGEPADLSELEAASVHQDARTGVTYVHLVQRYGGHEVFGTATAAAVLPDGQVRAAADRFQGGLAARVRATDPAVGAEAAAATAAHVAAEAARRAGQAAADGPPVLTDDPAIDGRPPAAVAPETDGGTPRLGYHALPDGALRLAWETVASATVGGGYALRRVRVDALTGAVLADDDLVVRDTWPAAPGPAAARSAAERRQPGGLLSAEPLAVGPLAAGPVRAGAYRVIPIPFENPERGGFALVTDPADPVASPRGWHDDGAQTYTITRGNNAYAYTDTDGNNEPDAGSAPNGGDALVFDFVFDPARPPAQNARAAVTNLFYWNNTVHDVAYRYGFDEGAGNFQTTNFTGAPGGGDYVLAEALDGSGLNNANFGTPPEGRSPRMQMFRWSGGVELKVTAPERLAGPYPSRPASFGPTRSFEGPLVQVRGPNGETLGCAGQITNDVAGKVALIERGECVFVEKVLAAQERGAVAVVVYNEPASPDRNGGEELVVMGGEDVGVEIPSTFVQRSTGLALRDASASVAATVLGDRDSGLDAGVVAHEYAHGISNRLVGGPQDVGCLSNGATDPENPTNNRPGEQMGEGWSDFYGLVLTMRPDDVATQARGVGTYLQFENPDGRGIRNAPYSTSFAVNDYTYRDVITSATHAPSGGRSLSIPHGVGFAWATMLWDMTWELVDAFGFSEDVADASGTAGNQIALNLVTTGLKLTPCQPGFVDGRDAILAADQVLYGGAYAPYIWRAFAGRGLGVDASQGSPFDPNDGAADFVAPEDLQGAVLLSAAEVGAAVAPGASATATVEVVNERDRPQTFTVDANALPPWLRVTPVTGTVPAGGRVALTVSLDPSPLATGVLRTTVPVKIGAASRLALAVRVETDGGFEGTHQLSPVGPNPSRDAFRFTLAVAEGQTVRATLYDALGRRVLATARALEAGTRESFTVDTGGLAAGVYVLQVAGDGFREARTLTVVR